jgi:hypothetical protein
MTLTRIGDLCMSGESIVSTPDGFMPGVEPASPRPTPEAPVALPPAPPAPDARFTAEDIARVREQEKSKVYNRLESLQAQVAELAAEREARAASEEAARLEAELADRKRVESETDVRDLLLQKEQEWEQKFRALEEDKERERALREKESAFNEFLAFKQQAVNAAANDILPELLDFVTGDTPEEIASSIAGLQARSTQIMSNTAEALAAARRDQRGVQPTGLPVAGPLDNESGNQPLTPEQISGMSMSEYAANRGRFGVTRSATGRGLFS